MPEVGPNPNSFWAQEALRKAQQDAAAQGGGDIDTLIAQLLGGQDTKTVEFGGKLYSFGPDGLKELATDPRYGQGRQPQYTVDERTGRVVRADIEGSQVGFAGIDPREKYSNELQQTGFTNQMQQRAQALNELENAQANVIRMAQMAEDAKMGRAQLGESKANRAEQGRQANLRAAVDQWQTAMNLIPAMGQLSLQESERVQGILSNGGDFLARAFESRGGTSPLGKVTQADQINALGQSMQTLRGMVQTNMAPVSSPYGDTSQDIGAYEAPQMPQGFSGAGSPMPQAPSFQISPAPAPSPASAGAGGGGGLAAPTPAPYVPNLTPPTFNPENTRSIDPVPTGPMPLPGTRPTYPGGGIQPAPDRPSLPELLNPFDDAVNLVRGAGSYIGNWLNPNKRPTKGFSGGGYTTEPVFLGNEKGAELFVNPTNAPIQILPADDTRKMGFSKGTTPGYDEGTSGWDQTIRPRPTGGFWNSFQEALEPLNAGAAQARDVWEADLDTDPGMMAMSLFGGPSGGGGVNMGKGFSQKIDPKLVQKAMAEFRASQIAKRLAQMADENIPGFATGTWDAGQAIQEFQRGNVGPMRGFNAQYNATAMPSGNNSGGWSGVGGMDPYANVGRNMGPTPPNIITNSDGSSRVRSQGGGFIDYASPGMQMQNSFAEADFYKKNGRMPRPGELGPAAQPYKPITQQELISMARANLPPAVGDVLGDRAVRPVTALESQAVPGNFLKTITARQAQALSPEEMQALGTMTNTEYNAPLSYVLGRTQAQYGPSQEMRRGFLRGAL